MAPSTSISDIRDFVMSERDKSVSDREWKHRLRGYGYAVRETARGRWVTSLLKGQDICLLT